MTVSRKLVLDVWPSASVTVMVMVVVPYWFVAGVRVAVRLVPAPLKEIFSLGTRTGLEELPVTVKLVAAVSPLLTVKATPKSGVSSSVAKAKSTDSASCGRTL